MSSTMLGDFTSSRPQQIARGALAGAFLLLGLWTLHNYLTALVWAAIIAIGIWPLYGRAQKRFPPGKHNLLLPLGFTAAIALVFILPLAIGGMTLTHDIHSATAFLVNARDHGIAEPSGLQRLPFGQQAVSSWWQRNLADPDGARALLGHGTHDAVSLGREFGGRFIHRLVTFGFTLVALFFLLREEATVSRQMRTASLRAFGPRGERLGRQVIASVHGTVDGLVLVGLGEGVILGIAYFVVGVPHATLMGGATAIAAMLPFGTAIVFVLAALLLVAKGSTVAAIGILVFGFVVAFAADHFVRPSLIGGATKLPFLWVLLGILGGVETWGLLGLFLGPAIMSALIMIWRDWSAEDGTVPTA